MENEPYRLYKILNDALRVARSPQRLNGANDFRVVWSKVFEVDKDDNLALLVSMSELIKLVKNTKDILQQNGFLDDPEDANFIHNIELALTDMNFEEPVSSLIKNINSETLTALRIMSKHLSKYHKIEEIEFSGDEISSLIEEIETLTSNITSSITLSDSVKTILLKNLNAIRGALQLYKVSGVEGIQKALEQTIGSIFLNHKEIAPVETDEDVKGIFNVINKLNSLLSTGVSIKELLAPVLGYFIK